jgi:hypothetical protein
MILYFDMSILQRAKVNNFPLESNYESFGLRGAGRSSLLQFSAVMSPDPVILVPNNLHLPNIGFRQRSCGSGKERSHRARGLKRGPTSNNRDVEDGGWAVIQCKAHLFEVDGSRRLTQAQRQQRIGECFVVRNHSLTLSSLKDPDSRFAFTPLKGNFLVKRLVFAFTLKASLHHRFNSKQPHRHPRLHRRQGQ